jgi:hypothetical protein
VLDWNKIGLKNQQPFRTIEPRTSTLI